MSSGTTQIAPRELTDDEVRSFRDHGWAKLEGLISPQAAGVLLERLRAKMGADVSVARHPAGASRGSGVEDPWRTFAPLSIDQPTGEVADDLFYGLSHSAEMGRLGMRLMGGPVRFWVDQSLVKTPVGTKGSGETFWHADVGARESPTPFDPPRQMQLWLALAEVTPEQGSMRFIAPRDLTEDVRGLVQGKAVADTYPELDSLGVLSPPLHLTPGDATVHGSDTFHSAAANMTADPRWGYVLSLFPAETRFSGQMFWVCDNVEGVVAGKQFPDRRFPVLS
jgi:Phytanoyl-CoA dioxygenase (PhyH)